jgi:quercetin dioxygenase-like cupin family protein
MSFPYKDGEIKVIIAKQDCELGNHYHKIKTEEFKLIKGVARSVVDGFDTWLVSGSEITIYPNEVHSFLIEKDSILFCICSHPYDKTDDYE